MFANVGRRNDDLCLADIVVLDEDTLEQIANIWIVVDDFPDAVDQVDDSLGHPVARSSLATEDGDARSELLLLLGGHGLDLKVAVNNAKDVELLSFILMNTLDLDVEEGSWVDGDSCGVLDVLGQANLVRILDLLPFLTEIRIINVCFDLMEQCEIFQVVIAAEFGSNQLGKAWVSLVQPPARSDAVRNVCELVWAINLDKVLEDCRLDQIGVKLGNAIHLVRTDDGQVRHANHLRIRLFDNRNPTQQIAVLWKVSLDKLQELQVYVVNDLKVTRKKPLHEWNGPFLKRLGQNGMVGI